jgi:biopolymer transport protein ExbD
MVSIAGLGRCSDVRDIVLRVRPHGRLTLNSEVQTRDRLARRLDEIYRSRWSKYVYISSEPTVPFHEVIEIVQLVSKHVDHVVIVTPSVLKQATYRRDGTCLAPNLPSGYPPG